MRSVDISAPKGEALCKGSPPGDIVPAVARGGKEDEDLPGLPRLPPGRHGLRREYVEQNQRQRLTAGIISAVAEKGYHETTISDIAAAAGISRRTFYGYFDSKEACFLDAYDEIGDYLRQAATAAADPDSEWGEQARAKLGSMLDTFAANPDLARFYLLAPPRAGEALVTRYREALSKALADFTAGMPPSPATRPVSDAAEQALVGGIAALIARRVDAGEGESLPELLPDLVELTLTPYLGREQALRLARTAS
jgi:AcrR family transcriptional regulator